MSPCHPFRPVPGQCGPNRRGPLPAPPFDPRDYWATRKCVSRLSASLGTKLDKVDVVDPGAATEAGKAADAKSTYEELGRIIAKLAEKADKATTLAGYGITDAATKTEIAAKADLVDGKVPAAQLPSYVDDVLEYGTMSAFPATGESGKIYVAKDANKTYRWSGTQYVEISPSPVLDDTVTAESPNGVKSSGIWSWVKSLLPHWLTSDYAEPATVESVATKADKTALDDKRDKDDLAVYVKVGVGDDWRFSDCPDDFRDWIETRGEKPHFFEGDNLWSMSGTESEKYRLSTDSVLAGGDAAVLRGFAWTDNESEELISPTITRSYKLRPVSPDDSLAKMSQLADAVSGLMPRDRSAGEEMAFPLGNVYLGGISKIAGWEKANGFYTKLGGFMAYGWDLYAVGFETPQTLPQYLDSLNWRTTGNRTLSDYGITDGATKTELAGYLSLTGGYLKGPVYLDAGGRIYTDQGGISVNTYQGLNVYGGGSIVLESNESLTDFDNNPIISATNPAFSNAVLSVGLNIDTNSVAVLNDIAETFGGFPIEGTATTVGGLLAALAAAAAWLKKNKVQTLKLNDNSVETSAENGVAKLDDFFTNSNSLLTGTIDDRLPIPISAKSAGFTTESYKRFIVTVSGDMTVTLHTPTSGDAEIFECRFNGSSLSADASITFAGATATTMDANCGTVTAGKVALMSAFWNGTTWDVNWKVEG